MERQNREAGLIDGMTADLGGPRTAELLSKLDAAVPWQELAKPIRKLYRNGQQGGRRPWPAVTMLKSLMLAKWFGLSDPQLEEQLCDRLSFRRFVGLSLDDATPDETSFVVFRRRLREAKLDEVLFQKALKHLQQQQLIVKEGTLVDASIVEAPRGGKRIDGSNTRDPEASFTRKYGRTYHGYKAHIATDKRGVITGQLLDTARVNDCEHFDELTANETQAVYGDAAYMDSRRERELKDRGVFCGIIKRRVKGQKQLAQHQQLINRLLAKTRATVEHPFAWMRQMGYGRTRYRGRRRNAFDLAMTSIAYNFKRSLSLVPV